MPAGRAARRTIAAVAVCAACALGVPASAQYFGRNKVQYHPVPFEVLKTEHFDIYFDPGAREGVDMAARLAERWYVRLERLFGHALRGRQPLVLYASPPDFEQTNIIGGELTEGTGGVTESVRRRIVLPFAGPIAETDHVIGHELVHAFQFDLTIGREMGPGENGAERLPLWFIEGMAEYLSIGPVDSNTAMWLRDAARLEQLPAIRDLDDPKYFPYRWGQAFWAYVAGRWGDEVIAPMLRVAASTGDVEAACQAVLEVTAKELSNDWNLSIDTTYAPVLAMATPPAETARLVIRGKSLGADLNIGPSISPDGRWIAFLSERSVLSTDLYIADASTGRIVHALTSTATDPHYTSLQFIYSAGAWDRASQRIAVATVVAGRPTLAIFDVTTGKRTREMSIQGVDEILNPTWAPDGHAIGFTGMTRGLTDLFIYDLNDAALRTLTHDAYADLHPAWSPDGRRIAFATDRFSSDLAALAMGAYRLAVIDVDSGAIEPVPAFARGKHINPQWSTDGLALYFISDRDGVPNLYRVTLGEPEGSATQITKVGTGVSGITSLSPAMSVSSRTGTIAFSVYEGGKYDIYTRDATAPNPPPAGFATDAAALPPVDRKRSEVSSLLSNPQVGLPDVSADPSQPYKPRLALEGVAQPMAGVGVSRFGAAVGGGLALTFGDVLENHQLGVGVMFDSSVGGMSAKNLAAEVAYLNQARRWNWGVIGGQTPHFSGGSQSGIATTPDGDLIAVDQMIVLRQTERSLSGLMAYPFDRARRIEFQGGGTHIAFDQIVETSAFSLNTGAVYDHTKETIPLGPSLTLGTASAAYVFDTASFGATSPVSGQRYRLETTPTFGSISFISLLADYRRYFMPVSFYTLGVRLIHHGRYGSGAEDPRLYPLDIGYPGLVRGYDTAEFDGSECLPSAGSGCPILDRLLGSRMLVGTLELRFPLLRPFGVSRRMYGPVPVEVALFSDMGAAWNRGQRPSFTGGPRGGVSSAGVALRINLFGVAIGEFDVVRPFQLPGRGWTVSFNFLPGW